MSAPRYPIARVIVADPPWAHNDALPGETRGAAKNYDVMPTREICQLRIPPTEPDALLFLWRLTNMPQDALDVCRAWGFTPKSELTWVKLTKGSASRVLKREVRIPKGTTQAGLLRIVMETHSPLAFAMGRYVRNSDEHCIIAARGRGASLIEDHGIRSTFFAPVGEHSEKPEEFFDIVERLTGRKGPYVELFARKKRRGWTTIGREVGSVLRPLEGATT